MGIQTERRVAKELGAVREFVARELHQQALEEIEVGLGVLVPNFQLLPHFVIEVLQQLLTRAGDRLVDLEVQFKLKLVEGNLDLVGSPAALVDRRDALLEIHARFDRTQDFVARTEHALE